MLFESAEMLQYTLTKLRAPMFQPCLKGLNFLDHAHCYVTTGVRIVPGFFFLLFKLLLPLRVNSVSFSCFNLLRLCQKLACNYINILKYLLLAGAGNSYLLELRSVWYLQYQLHYFVDPRVAASLSYSYDSFAPLRRTLATSVHLSFAGEKTIGEFLMQSLVNVIF